jgi:hypothetical protein
MSEQAEQFPLLREFARGYLHQDLIPEHGDPLGAAKAYLKDLGTDERKNLAAESQKMLTALRQWSAAELNRQLHRMGSAWNFVSPHEFEQVLRLFDRGK